ncbi:transposase, partial [Clostridium polyendosporum]|uniref:transposase n=1 Tax=Clostridium polyendosporum TaxID=69208 RepID=UPI001BB4022C
MIRERKEAQCEIEVVMLEQLVPQDHLLRKIDKYIDFSFIRDLTNDLYCHTNGRPGVDPVVLFKILFIGYLYGIRSERQLVRDIEVNLAYRW